MPITYATPRRARYTPVKSKLAYPVLVHASRRMFGRVEYHIGTYNGMTMAWVTAGHDGQQLQFEEGEP